MQALNPINPEGADAFRIPRHFVIPSLRARISASAAALGGGSGQRLIGIIDSRRQDDPDISL